METRPLCDPGDVVTGRVGDEDLVLQREQGVRVAVRTLVVDVVAQLVAGDVRDLPELASGQLRHQLARLATGQTLRDEVREART